MATTGGAAFTAAVRMVNRVHDDAAYVRTLSAPTRTAGLTIIDVAVIGVRYSTDRCEARAVHQTLLARVQAQDRHALVTADELSVSSGGAGDLTALARLHLHIVDDGADRNELQRHRIAGLDVNGLFRGNHLVADSQALRRQDIGLLTVRVVDERDERRAVRVIFQTLDRAFDVELATLEVDQTVGPLVTTALETNGDATQVVATALGGQALGQRLDRLALVEASRLTMTS